MSAAQALLYCALAAAVGLVSSAAIDLTPQNEDGMEWYR